jgi:hypothetical protein
MKLDNSVKIKEYDVRGCYVNYPPIFPYPPIGTTDSLLPALSYFIYNIYRRIKENIERYC